MIKDPHAVARDERRTVNTANKRGGGAPQEGVGIVGVGLLPSVF